MQKIFSTFLLIFLGILLCSVAFCQTQTKDSTWITNTGGVFFENKYTEFDNGNSTLDKKRIGDTMQIFSAQVLRVQTTSQTLANDIEITSAYSSAATELIRQSNATKAQIKRSALDSIVKPQRPYFLDSIWSIRDNGVKRNIVFSFTAQGVFRYKIDTFQVRTSQYLGSIIRLNNYMNTGKDLDLYLFKNKRWYNATRTVQMFSKGLGPASASSARNVDVSSTSVGDTTQIPQPQTIPIPVILGDYTWDGKMLTLKKAKK